MQNPPAQGNYCDEHENVIKPTNIQYYNWYVGYTDKSDRMTNSCLI
jgi:hypothetical protein